MKARQLLVGLVLAILGFSYAQAGEDRSFDPYMRVAINEVKAILIAAGKCSDMNDCSKRDIVFFNPKPKGVDLTVYGITDPAIVQIIITAMAKQYYSLPSGSSLRVRFFVHTHSEDMKRGFLRSAPVFAELSFTSLNQ